MGLREITQTTELHVNLYPRPCSPFPSPEQQQPVRLLDSETVTMGPLRGRRLRTPRTPSSSAERRESPPPRAVTPSRGRQRRGPERAGGVRQLAGSAQVPAAPPGAASPAPRTGLCRGEPNPAELSQPVS